MQNARTERKLWLHSPHDVKEDLNEPTVWYWCNIPQFPQASLEKCCPLFLFSSHTHIQCLFSHKVRRSWKTQTSGVRQSSKLGAVVELIPIFARHYSIYIAQHLQHTSVPDGHNHVDLSTELIFIQSTQLVLRHLMGIIWKNYIFSEYLILKVFIWLHYLLSRITFLKTTTLYRGKKCKKFRKSEFSYS